MNSQVSAVGQLTSGLGVGVIGKFFGLRAAVAVAGLSLSPRLPLYARSIRQRSQAIGEVGVK